MPAALRKGYLVMSATNLVNLDAMIPRQDLEARSSGASSQSGMAITIQELAKGKLFYSLLRKPDFQRETDDWSVDNVVTFIKSFRDGHLIPAVIMWRTAESYTFVIDGAHRLSALIAWVNDDYGDREISQKFYGYKIPLNQSKAAKECRDRVAAEVGTFSDLNQQIIGEMPIERMRWAQNISTTLAAQTVPGSAENAEASFMTINQRSVAIDATEKMMIESRRKPNVIAARALVRCATGHEYWSKFSKPLQEDIKTKAKASYDVLFEPENAEILQTIEMPIAGKAYSADSLRLVLDLINYANDLKTPKSIEDVQEDPDGTKTVRFLDRTYGVTKYLSGQNPASLGLHPAVYFWGKTGKHQPSAFLAVVSLIQYLVANDLLYDFCRNRAKFEEFLVSRQSVVKHILGAYGGWKKSAPAVFEMFKIIFHGYRDGKSEREIEKILVENPRFTNLSELIGLDSMPNKKPTKETRISVRRDALLKSAIRCTFCHARLPSNSFSDDHTIRVEDGGRGNEENITLMHRYCNHGAKEKAISQGDDPPNDPFGGSNP